MSSTPLAGDRRPDDRESRDSTSREPAGPHPATGLRAVVVSYPNRPDRRTVCPRGLSREELLVTWMTANNHAFVDLLASR